ncbi:protein of unknown function [Methylocella tundrae]|nr:protein of unknown function [Methylocella tundrae]
MRPVKKRFALTAPNLPFCPGPLQTREPLRREQLPARLASVLVFDMSSATKTLALRQAAK